MSDVTIHYRRLPDRVTVFRQRLVHHDAYCIITLMERTPLPGPLHAGGRIILEPGAPAVWFTFPGAWHDIGRFHTADGTFTGWYANILTPVRFRAPLEWETTDLCLDVWLAADGSLEELDRDEFGRAVAGGWIDDATAAAAEAETGRILEAAAAAEWPPPAARSWTLESARSALLHGRHPD